MDIANTDADGSRSRPKPRSQRGHWSLRTQLAVGAAILSVLATLTLSLVIGAVTLDRMRGDAGNAARALAQKMAALLSRDMAERFGDIQVLGSLSLMSDPATPSAEKRRLLDQLQETFPDFAWIGIADDGGKVTVSTGGILEGADVSQRPWFIDGRWGPTVKDVHDAVLLAKLLPAAPDGQPLRFVDVATPLHNAAGRVGVLGAHLSWHWATELRDSLLQTMSADDAIEILVLAKDGTVLLGPEAELGNKPDLASIAAARDGATGHDVERWPDGAQYLVGYTASTGYRLYPGLGWIVLVRQPVKIAFASANEVERNLIVGGIFVTLLLALGGWLLARHVTRPILAIAGAADRLAGGADAARPAKELIESLPDVKGSREVIVLQHSLHHLLDQLRQRERALVTLNRSLEMRVAERTESLTTANGELQREIALRADLERERERLIAELRSLAETDSLTGLSNRRAFVELAQRELRRMQRRGGAMTLLMIDIDYFKRVNDTHGHPAGDAVLREVAGLVRGSLRDVDISARLGGEEFGVLLADGDPAQVPDLAERLRHVIATHDMHLPDGSSLRVTASFGVAVATGAELTETSLERLMAAADRALYRAKGEGRNRVVMAGPEDFA
ncbi:diguanylate cyclase (GGDEF)-like protein [Dongia mobilis]|uniref:diguanylate cyclase n=1 Tax=Dongia mobilis TaxID=578943 RepID=A0A4R6WPU4_9PROT|nr:sensor domain-containing diguanylate cyclase [Dongia mobilis]TDQ81509.1 diguanylate cyclase (GGDEF)-like protein [Dongia mobilis]